MKRYYRLLELIEEEEIALKILDEIRELPNVASADFADGGAGIIIGTEDGEFGEVMNRAVNIFAREGKTELSFDHFVPEN